MACRRDDPLERFENSSACHYLCLALITLLAAGLRFYKLGEWSFWDDEVLWVTFAQNIFDYSIFHRWPISAPLMYAAMAELGTGEWSARLVPALIGIITIPALYFPFRHLFGPAVALLAVLLLAISPWHIYMSQNARFYSALLLFSSLSLMIFYSGLEKDRFAFILLSMGLLMLAIRERHYALFLAPVLGLYLLLLMVGVMQRPPGLRLRNFVPLFLPLLAFGQWDRFLLSLLTVPYFGPPNHDPLRLLASVIYWAGLPLLGFALIGTVPLLRDHGRKGALVALGAWVPVILLTGLSVYTFTATRYILVSLPFWAVSAAVGAKDLFSRNTGRGRLLVSGLVCLLLADPVSQGALYYIHQNGNRPDWRGAFNFVRERRADGDIVLSTRTDVGEYYLGSDVEEINTFGIRAAQTSGQRVWFVIDEDSGWVDPNLYRWIMAEARFMEYVSVNLSGKSMSIRIYLYQPESLPPTGESPSDQGDQGCTPEDSRPIPQQDCIPAAAAQLGPTYPPSPRRW
jgi:mannosyltransferase